MLSGLLIFFLSLFPSDPICSDEQTRVVHNADLDTGIEIDIYAEGKKCRTIVIFYRELDLRPYQNLTQYQLKESLKSFITDNQMQELSDIGFRTFAIRDKFGTNKVVSIK